MQPSVAPVYEMNAHFGNLGGNHGKSEQQESINITTG
jgi:hypothetical protein